MKKGTTKDFFDWLEVSKKNWKKRKSVLSKKKGAKFFFFSKVAEKGENVICFGHLEKKKVSRGRGVSFGFLCDSILYVSF